MGLGVGFSVVCASLLSRILSFGFCAFLPVLGLSMPTLQVRFGIIGSQEVGSIQVSAIIPSPWIWCRGALCQVFDRRVQALCLYRCGLVWLIRCSSSSLTRKRNC